MSFLRSRRALLLAALASSVLAVSCGGGGTVESQLVPTNVYGFGDSFADLGQAGGRYTVNDGSVNIWAQQVAANYGRTLTASSAGGGSYATGNARVAAATDAAGNANATSVAQQVSTFLAARSPARDDLLLISAGIGDIIAETQKIVTSAQSEAAARAAIEQAGRDLGAQVRRLVNAGARHVVIVGSYNLGRSPWAAATGQGSRLTTFSARFNEELLISIVDLGASVLYVDAALYFNLATAAPNSYGFDNALNAACTSTDAGAGIGIGTGRVNASLCTPGTLGAGVDPNRFLFADEVYPTPQGHRLFGNYAYERIRNRW